MPRFHRAVAALLLLGLTALAQDPAAPAGAGRDVKAIDIFREARDLINDGRFELAADTLKEFLGKNPTEQDYLDVEAKYGATAFLKLLAVPRYYDDPKREAEFRKSTKDRKAPLDALVEASIAANEKVTKDPKRIKTFVLNLGKSPEERGYAIRELRRSGDAALPALIESFRFDTGEDQQAGLLTAVRELGVDVVPGLLAAAEGLQDSQKIGILKAVAYRPDMLSLATRQDTDFRPLLWHYAASGKELGRISTELLRSLTGGVSDRTQPWAELTRLAGPCYDRKAQFATLDKTRNRIKYWTWDAPTNSLKFEDLTPPHAEEKYGLKYLKWAIEAKAGYEPAEKMFLALAAERSVERSNFTDPAKSEPAVYGLLASAPSATLIDLLETAIAEKKTSLAFATVTALGDRADRTAVAGTAKPDGTPKPGLLEKALDYPDPRVQFAAATAILKAPAGTPHGSRSKIVDILRRAAGGAEGEKTSKAKALVADPRTARADQIAAMLGSLGYETEQVGSGRELLRRVRKASDIDMVIVDRHLADPELSDVLAALTSDASFGRRPVFVVASTDRTVPVAVESLLLRLAVLIAATETDSTDLPQPLPFDKRKTPEEIETERANIALDRDRQFNTLGAHRLERMERIVKAADLSNNAAVQSRLDVRLPQLTLATIVAEFDPTPASAPLLAKKLAKYNQLVASNADVDNAVEAAPTGQLVKLILQLEGALTPALRQKFETIRGRIDAEALGLKPDSARSPAVEQTLVRAVRGFPGVAVIPEPFSRLGLEGDLESFITQSEQKPRSPVEKQATAKVAVDWLRRLAVGELPGYDVKPAEAALLLALNSDDTAADAADAVTRIPTAASQQALVRTSLDAKRPAGLRTKAADAAARHVQGFGKLTPPEVTNLVTAAATNDPSPELKAKFNLLRALLAGTPSDLSNLIKNYSDTKPAPAKVETAPPPPAPPAGEKN